MSLSAAELASMQAVVTDSLPTTAEVRRPTPASDGQGGVTETWATVATWPCYLSEDRRPIELAEAGRITAEGKWKACLPIAADVHPPDRLRIGGVDYEVADTDAASSLSLSVTAYLRRLL